MCGPKIEVVPGWLLVCSLPDKTRLKKVGQRLENNFPGRKYQVMNFGVDLKIDKGKIMPQRIAGSSLHLKQDEN